ncbi:MAG: hypothetical protein H6716_19830 [Polyangiaceae bacterium]|nr:hypothetical protein [Polyangiaceae bacterium]
MSRTTALKVACFGGTLLAALGCGRVIEPGEEEGVQVGLCDPSQEWHLVDEQLDERAGQSLLWFGDGPVVATQFTTQNNWSSVERFDGRGDELFRKDISQRVNLLSKVGDGFLAVGHGDGSPRRTTLEYHTGGSSFEWRVAFETEEDVWPAGVYQVDDALLLIGTQETYSGADKDLVVYGLSDRGEPRFTRVYGDDPPTLGESSDERVVGSYAFENHVVIVSQAWLNGSGGPVKALAINSAGELLWEYSDTFQYARGTSWTVAPTSDGGALITGSPSTGGVGTGPGRLLRLDGKGQRLWVQTLNDPDIEDPEVTASVQLPDGDFFISALGWGPAVRSYRIDPQGNIRSTIVHTEEQLAGAPGFTRVRLMPGGGVLLSSELRELDGGTLNLLRVDNAGQPLWQHRIDRPGTAFIGDLVVGPDGQVVMAGRFAKQDSVDERHVLQLSDACQLEHAAP